MLRRLLEFVKYGFVVVIGVSNILYLGAKVEKIHDKSKKNDE